MKHPDGAAGVAAVRHIPEAAPAAEVPFPRERFAGVERLYGTGSIDTLAQAHVCVIGIGGVGSWAAEALARSGVGHLTLIDADENPASLFDGNAAGPGPDDP